MKRYLFLLGLFFLGAYGLAAWKSNVKDAVYPLSHQRIEQGSGTFEGVIQIRKVITYSGCTVPPTENIWAVLEYHGFTLPLKSVSPDEAKAIAENESLGFRVKAPLWTYKELRNAGIESGTKVRVEGVIAPLFFSGTEGMAKVYGICTVRIR